MLEKSKNSETLIFNFSQICFFFYFSLHNFEKKVIEIENEKNKCFPFVYHLPWFWVKKSKIHGFEWRNLKFLPVDVNIKVFFDVI